MSSKPTIVFVPASFSPPAMYNMIVEKLQSQGYEVHVVTTPSVGKKEGPAPTMLDDSAAIQKVLSEVADQGKDILLVAHSYGGIPLSESIKGYSKDVRAKEGRKGGVVKILYVTCLVTRVGESAQDTLVDAPPLGFISVEVGCYYIRVIITKRPESKSSGNQGEWMSLDADGHADHTFNDLPHDQGVYWTKQMSEHSAPSFQTKLTYAGYKDVPVSWLFCEDDIVVPPEMQQKFIDLIEEESGRKVDVHRLKAGHSPFTSQPDETVEVIRKVASAS
jgi:hypothetical protein